MFPLLSSVYFDENKHLFLFGDECFLSFRPQVSAVGGGSEALSLAGRMLAQVDSQGYG